MKGFDVRMQGHRHKATEEELGTDCNFSSGHSLAAKVGDPYYTLEVMPEFDDPLECCAACFFKLIALSKEGKA